MKTLKGTLLLLVVGVLACGQPADGPGESLLEFPAGFVWGTATSAYQVEGAYNLDGKGPSVWDVYTNVFKLAGGETGNVAIDQYHRYKEDVALLKEMGVESYRFSLAWSRILPDGTGEINQAGVDYYNGLIDELLAAGIQPAITLYHWDLPLALAERGGWRNREFVEWFVQYAQTAFDAFGDRVPTWITFNEPFIDRMLIGGLMSVLLESQQAVGAQPPDNPLELSADLMARQSIETHHLMLAHAGAVKAYRARDLTGEIGITLSISPTFPETESDADMQAARLEDGLHNRWFLDPVLKGQYPEDILALYQTREDVGIIDGDVETIRENRADFLGVNYYSPLRVRSSPESAHFGVEIIPNPDETAAFNGEVYPEGLYDLLTRIDHDYNHPRIYITENGAGFGPQDDQLTEGAVHDSLRIDYLSRHFAQAHRAIRDGVKLERYYVWSCFDNFEWVFGYSRRFGLFYVDFDTQERIWKDSAHMFRSVIERNGVLVREPSTDS